MGVGSRPRYQSGLRNAGRPLLVLITIGTSSLILNLYSSRLQKSAVSEDALWPSVVFNEPSHEFVFSLWCNSTLGLLCHWWTSNKTQSGRGTTTIMSIPFIPTLDVRNLSSHQHEAARVEFDRLARERFLPFDQIDADPARSELDRALLIRVLGLDPALCDVGGPLELLRRKLAAEPQIHADKRNSAGLQRV